MAGGDLRNPPEGLRDALPLDLPGGCEARGSEAAVRHPDREKVIRAARLANAHDFIRQPPLAYETRIGESGLLLSDGQQQRAIQGNMAALLAGARPSSSHRLSTIRNAELMERRGLHYYLCSQQVGL